VHRDFAGIGLSKKMVDFATQEAKRRDFVRLRLDTDARKAKLCTIYGKLSFTLVGKETVGDSSTAFFEKRVV
jgi:GNAT superfamily N-acetyltransferase